MRFTFAFLVCLLLASVVTSQRRRNRNRKSKSGSCHLKDIEKCLDSLSVTLGKGDNPSQIIASAQGLDRMCSAIRSKLGSCVRDYFKKCGTPLHREVAGLVVDQMMSHVKDLCAKGPKREKFLQWSPCLHEKVFSQPKHKQDCNGRYWASLALKHNDSVQSVCCSYRQWEECSRQLIRKECPAEGALHAFHTITTDAFLNFPALTCPADLFQAQSDQCQRVQAKEGARGRPLADGASKYNVAHVFAYMFDT